MWSQPATRTAIHPGSAGDALSGQPNPEGWVEVPLRPPAEGVFLVLRLALLPG
jgi:hypothetical protein